MLVNIGGFEGVASPLDLVRRILESGNFSDPIENPGSKPGERIIGEMNDEEKALYTANVMISEAGTKLAIASIDALLAIEPVFFDRNSTQGNRQQLFLFKEWNEAINSLFWATLKGHYAEDLSPDKVSSVGVYSGFRIATLPAKEEDLFAGSLMAALFGGGVDPHDCANCPGYDECDSPIKMTPAQIAAERGAVGQPN